MIYQAKLAHESGIDLKPSTLIIFGNPPLGTQFIEARPEAGLDWPVRLLVYADAKGQVWMAYTDFDERCLLKSRLRTQMEQLSRRV